MLAMILLAWRQSVVRGIDAARTEDGRRKTKRRCAAERVAASSRAGAGSNEGTWRRWIRRASPWCCRPAAVHTTGSAALRGGAGGRHVVLRGGASIEAVRWCAQPSRRRQGCETRRSRIMDATALRRDGRTLRTASETIGARQRERVWRPLRTQGHAGDQGHAVPGAAASAAWGARMTPPSGVRGRDARSWCCRAARRPPSGWCQRSTAVILRRRSASFSQSRPPPRLRSSERPRVLGGLPRGRHLARTRAPEPPRQRAALGAASPLGSSPPAAARPIP